VTRFVTEALRRDHPRASFSCGVEALDRYLRELALQDVKRLVTGCFVAVDETGDIGGYYTLAATHVPIDDLPPETSRKLPRYPLIPAMLIGRLAVAAKHRGQGLGRALVADAAIRTKGFGVGAFALIVEAKDRAAVAFYEANGFTLIPTETRRLFLPVATALSLVDGKSGQQKP
jgi:GNAT superfamily N-acetyltransferase